MGGALKLNFAWNSAPATEARLEISSPHIIACPQAYECQCNNESFFYHNSEVWQERLSQLTVAMDNYGLVRLHALKAACECIIALKC